MKTNHLFAAAAIAVALLAAAPAYSQIVAGGARGGLGDTFRAGGGRLNSAAGGSLQGRADGQFDELSRTRRTVDIKTEGATRAGTHAAGAALHQADNLAAVTRQEASQGEARVRRTGDATGTASASAQVASQGATQGRELNAAGALDGAAAAKPLSNTGASASPPAPQRPVGSSAPASRGESVTRSSSPAPTPGHSTSGNSAGAGRSSTWTTHPSMSVGGDASASASADTAPSASSAR